MNDKDGTNREYVSKGVSALPDWWDRVEEVSTELGMNRSLLIRMAVDTYLKDERVETRITLAPIP